jgi:hypothetical protein
MLNSIGVETRFEKLGAVLLAMIALVGIGAFVLAQWMMIRSALR